MIKDPSTMTYDEIVARQKEVGEALGKYKGDWSADRDPKWHELRAERDALAAAYMPALQRAGEETALKDTLAAAEAEDRARERQERITAAVEARRK